MEEVAAPRNEAARAILAKNFPSTARSTKNTGTARQAARIPAKVPTDPIKLAQYQKLELMKLRHRAVPGDSKDEQTSVPSDQRIHVKVIGESKTERFFWFRKVCFTS